MITRDRELMVARLERVKELLEKIEQACAESAALRRAFARTKRDLLEAARALEPVNRGLYDPDQQP